MAAALIMIAAMLGSMAWAAGKSDHRKVVACIETGRDSADVVGKAASISYRLFRPAGVKLDLHTGWHSCEAQRGKAILVSLSMHTPKDLLPGAFAHALPYEGVHIEVFYDRMAHTEDDLRPYLLAYVVVHEITHILEGVARHSDSGIMKAHWDSDEYALMRRGQLRFAEEDIKLIHKGLAAPAAHPASGTLAAASGLAAARN
jgi:hypothetical protein